MVSNPFVFKPKTAPIVAFKNDDLAIGFFTWEVFEHYNWVSGIGFQVSGTGFQVSGTGFQVSGSRFILLAPFAVTLFPADLADFR